MQRPDGPGLQRPTTPPPSQLEALAVQVAVEAARLVHDHRPAQVRATATKSSPTDVVTEMDRQAEELIRSRLAQARPADAVLGEEGSDRPGTSGVTWVVDPIDGTVNYLYDIPAYGVSVAAATGDPRVPGQWQVLAGAVADPSMRRVFHAGSDGGAWVTPMDGGAERSRRLSVGTAPDLASSLVGTGFGYTAARRRVQGEVLLQVLPQVRDIRRIGSASLDLCAVAAGTLDGFYEVGLNPWDLAAGWLIVTEAGGVVSGPEGATLGDLPGGLVTVAGNPAVHDLLVETLRDAVAGRATF